MCVSAEVTLFLAHQTWAACVLIVYFLFQISALLSALSTVNNYKIKKAKVKHREQLKEYLKVKQKEDEQKFKRQKEAKKKVYRILGQREKKRQKSSLKGSSKGEKSM